MTRILIVFFICLLIAGCTNVRIETTPDGAKTIINGKNVGTTPLTINLRNLSFDFYQVILEKEGYEPLHTTLKKEFTFWKSGLRSYYYFELDPLPTANQTLLSPLVQTNEERIDLKKLTASINVGVWKSDVKQKTIVLNFDSSYPGSDGKTVAELFSVELVKRNLFTVVDRSRIAQILEEQKLKLSGITAEEKEIKIGRLIGADKIITGSVLKIGGSYFIIVKGVSVSSSSVEVSDRVFSTSLNGLINAIPELADSFIYQALGKK